MKKVTVMAVLAACAFVLMSCADSASVTPKNTTAANNTAPANTTAPASSATAEADIKKMLKDTETALSKNDTEALDKIYAPDYTLVNQEGVMQTRAERLASMKSGDLKYESFAYSDVNVRVYGDAAVGNYIATFKATNKGKSFGGTYRVSSTWIKGKDGWRQVNAQATQIAEAPKPDDAKKDEMKKDDTKKDALKQEDAKKTDEKKEDEKK